jgi:hypothetical protein
MASRKKIHQQFTDAIAAEVKKGTIPAPGEEGYETAAIKVVERELKANTGGTRQWLMVGGAVGIAFGTVAMAALAQPAQDDFTKAVQNTLDTTGIPPLARVAVTALETTLVAWGLKKAKDTKLSSTALTTIFEVVHQGDAPEKGR